MGIYTSRYSNKELADGKYYCVGISIGTPKFKLAYRLENQCYSLAPKGYMLRMNLEDFKKAYYEKLNGIGKDRIISMVMKMERDAAEQETLEEWLRRERQWQKSRKQNMK